MDIRESNKLRNFPIVMLVGFLCFTELFFVLGPMSYEVDNLFGTFLYLLLNNVCLVLGYRYYMSSLKKECVRHTERDNHNIRILKYIIVISSLCIPIRMNVLWNVNPFSIAAVVDHVMASVFNPGDVYKAKLAYESGFLTYVNMFVNLFVYISLAAGIYYFGKMSKGWKVMIGILIFMELIFPIGQGVRKGIMDTLLLVFFVGIAAYPNLILRKKQRRRLLWIGVTACCMFIFYFVFSNMSRNGVDDATVLTEGNNIYASVREGYRSLPPLLIVALCSIQGYACQGYYALSLALSMPYRFCYFLGSSWFGVNLSHRYGIEIFDRTYIARLEAYGIDSTINWHSLYTWLANDVSFFIVPLLISLMGFFLAKTWNDTICNRSLFAPPAFFFFVIMVFYAFANNQVFSFMFIPFIITFVLWEIDRKHLICLK